MKKLDQKFDGVIFKVKDGSIVPPDQYIVFLAKDNAVPAMLQVYLRQCEIRECPRAQLEAVRKLIDQVGKWRDENVDLCKNPDVIIGEALLE